MTQKDDAVSQMKEDGAVSKMKEDDAVSNIKDDAVSQIKKDDAVPVIKKDDVSQIKKDDVSQIKKDDAVSQVKKDDAVSKIKEDDAVSKIKEDDAVSQVKKDDAVSQIKEDDVVSKIAERLEFFFSVPNLRSDPYLQKELDREDDFGGSIVVKKLLNFKSIKEHTSDEDKVIEAAKTLPDLLIVSDDKRISSKKPLDKSQLDDNIPLSLHLSNLPVKNGKFAVGVFNLKPIFEKYGNVTLIRMKWRHQNDNNGNNGQRKGGKPVPNGCVLEFEKKEELEKAVADLIPENGDDKKGLEIKGEKIVIKKLSDWIAAEKEIYRKKMEERGKNKEKEGDDKGEKSSDKRENNEKKRAKPAPEPVQFTFDWKPGCVIELKGLDEKSCDRESIKAIAELGSTSVWADYSRGQSDGAVRFSEPSDEIKKLAEKLNSGEVKIGDAAVGSARVLEGDDEKAYWKKWIEYKTKLLQQRQDERSGKHSFHSRKKKNFRSNRR